MLGTRWQDWANLALGGYLFSMPWLFAPALQGIVAWNAWIAGAIVVLVSLNALLEEYDLHFEWTNVLVGVWALLSPWMLGFSGSTIVAWNTAAAGLLIALVGLSSVYQPAHTRP